MKTVLFCEFCFFFSFLLFFEQETFSHDNAFKFILRMCYTTIFYCEWNFLASVNGVFDAVDSVAIVFEEVAYICDASADVDVLFNRIDVESAIVRKFLPTYMVVVVLFVDSMFDSYGRSVADISVASALGLLLKISAITLAGGTTTGI